MMMVKPAMVKTAMVKTAMGEERCREESGYGEKAESDAAFPSPVSLVYKRRGGTVKEKD
jgi:hypothetical protein